MRIPIESFGKIATTQKQYLTEHLVRFCYEREQAVPKIYQMILEDDEDTSHLFPDAPNREAVKHNFLSQFSFQRNVKGYEWWQCRELSYGHEEVRLKRGFGV